LGFGADRGWHRDDARDVGGTVGVEGGRVFSGIGSLGERWNCE
jgi:hypothetical protein